MAHLLLVEDDLVLADVLARLARLVGHTVRLAATAGDALATVGDERPDLILADLSLPDMDGCVLIRHLRSDCRSADVPVLAMSGIGVEREAEARASGADRVISKPFASAELFAEVRALLGTTIENGGCAAPQ